MLCEQLSSYPPFSDFDVVKSFVAIVKPGVFTRFEESNMFYGSPREFIHVVNHTQYIVLAHITVAV